MSQDSTYSCVVVGDEPAGLWLLRRLLEIVAASGDPTPFPVAWLRLGDSADRLAVPAAVASEFALPADSLSSHWSAEIVDPRRSFSWDEASLRHEFPELPRQSESDALKILLAPTSRHLNSLRQAIRLRPELLTYSAGLMKALSRSESVSPETAVLGAMAATTLVWWEPQRTVPAAVTRLESGDARVTKASGGLTLELSDGRRITSPRWILNCTHGALHRFTKDATEFHRVTGIDPLYDARGHSSLYPMSVRAEREAIGVAVRPLSLLFDTPDIADPDTEVWPLERPRPGEGELVLWVTAPCDPSLEVVQERARRGMGRLNRIFPFLSRALQSISLPLSTDSCHSDDARGQAIAWLEKESIERYAMTLLHTGTRTRHVSMLFPNLFCHLPYPLGPLQAARGMAEEIVGKRRRPKVDTKNPAPALQ